MSNSILRSRAGTIAADSRKTRRAALQALTGFSALAAARVTSIASQLNDPIISAIERHKAAYKVREVTSFAIDDLINDPKGPEVSETQWGALEQANLNERNAFAALLTVPPETTVGMRSIIAHLISIDDGRLTQEMRQLLALMVDSPLLARHAP